MDPLHEEDAGVKIEIIDMEEAMKNDAIQTALEAMKLSDIEMDIASHIKREFDHKHAPTWHCIVGKKFGSFVTHEAKVPSSRMALPLQRLLTYLSPQCFIYFYMKNLAILLFKVSKTPSF